MMNTIIPIALVALLLIWAVWRVGRLVWRSIKRNPETPHGSCDKCVTGNAKEHSRT